MRRSSLLLMAALLLPPAPGLLAHPAMAAPLPLGAGSGQTDDPGPPVATSAAPRATHPLREPFYPGGYGRAYGMRPGSPFIAGLLGGFLGAGLGGLLFGGGFFHAMHGAAGVLGVLLQLLVAYTLAVWLYRRLTRGLAPAGPGLYARMAYPGAARELRAARRGSFGGGRKGRPITLTNADFRSFEELLHCMQAAWSAWDMDAIRSMTTPEMAAPYAAQLAALKARKVWNKVSDVHLLHGDVTEAWSDGRRDYAIASMNFSSFDVTYDSFGQVVDGSETERVTVLQFWSFERLPRAKWVVSGIEEGK